MTRVDRWWSETPRRPRAEYACELARSRAWSAPELVFVTTVPDLEEAAPLLELEVELAHALVLVLSALPEVARGSLASAFYDRRGRDSAPAFGLTDPVARLAAAAATAALVLEVARRPELQTPRVVDLLAGAAQRDDVSLTPVPALLEMRDVVARARAGTALDDPLAARSAATTAVLEVLDPSSGEVALQEIVLRATWAALRSWDTARVLEFLLALDAAFEHAVCQPG